jgi:3-hydroxyacyl-CoA dehydrogenase
MDTAMRLGFNWPRGPLELTELIGPERAAGLLEELRRQHGDAYRPAPRLLKRSVNSRHGKFTIGSPEVHER